VFQFPRALKGRDGAESVKTLEIWLAEFVARRIAFLGRNSLDKSCSSKAEADKGE
jgi:hypothetical protein